MHKWIDQLDLGAEGLWFPATASILLALITIFIPKKGITWREIYITFGVVGFVTWVSDGLIARTFDLLDLGHPQKAGLGEILSYTFVPSSLAVLYINYFTPKNKWKLVIIFTIVSALVEVGMIYSGYMKYRGWNWGISIITFLIIYGFLLPIHIKIIKNSSHKNEESSL